jgi:ribosome-interacting GTPase 1
MMMDPLNCCISVHFELGIDILLDKIWEQLALVRVYTKRKGGPPDFSDPLILTEGRHGLTIKGAIL